MAKLIAPVRTRTHCATTEATHSRTVSGVYGLVFLLLLLLLSGCSSTKEASFPPSETFAPPKPYVRISEIPSNHLELQIAAREFRPVHGRGPGVWLVGASHIGESNYYALLQEHLNAQKLVLFEGIGATRKFQRSHKKSEAATPDNPATSASSGLQASMANALGLRFQLDAIDYARTNFQNTDLSLEELRTVLVKNAASAGTNASSGTAAGFEALVEALQGGSFLDTVLQMLVRLLGTNPKFQAYARLGLIEMLSGIQGDPMNLKSLPEDMKQLLEVLLINRNQKVIEELGLALKEHDSSDSIAVFYGCGHMPDLEQRLRRDLHYRPEQELWFVAFSTDLNRVGVSPSERHFIETFIKSQLQ
jgi:hypothetical protein